jgi:hypothetical protein
MGASSRTRRCRSFSSVFMHCRRNHSLRELQKRLSLLVVGIIRPRDGATCPSDPGGGCCDPVLGCSMLALGFVRVRAQWAERGVQSSGGRGLLEHVS